MKTKEYLSQIKALKLHLSFLFASICAVPLIASSEAIGGLFKETTHELLIKSTFLITGIACFIWLLIGVPTMLILFLLRLVEDDPRNAAFSGGVLILSTFFLVIFSLTSNFK